MQKIISTDTVLGKKRWLLNNQNKTYNNPITFITNRNDFEKNNVLLVDFRNYFFTIFKNNYYIAHSLFYTYVTEKISLKRKHLWYVTHLFTIIYKNISTNVALSRETGLSASVRFVF